MNCVLDQSLNLTRTVYVDFLTAYPLPKEILKQLLKMIFAR